MRWTGTLARPYEGGYYVAIKNRRGGWAWIKHDNPESLRYLEFFLDKAGNLSVSNVLKHRWLFTSPHILYLPTLDGYEKVVDLDGDRVSMVVGRIPTGDGPSSS